jgi:hypothetical protein
MADGERNMALTSKKKKLDWESMVKLAISEDKHHKNMEEIADDIDHLEIDIASPTPARTIWYTRPEEGNSPRRTPHNQGEFKQKPVSPNNWKPMTFHNSTWKSGPNGQQADNIPNCDWCGKKGHTIDRCWSRKGACLLCGDEGHKREGCSRYDASRARKPTCIKCNGPHWARNCDQPSN